MVRIAEIEHPQAGVEIGQEAHRLVLEEVWVAGSDVLIVRAEASSSGAERFVCSVAWRPWGRKEADHPGRHRVYDVYESCVVDRLVAAFLQRLGVQHDEISSGKRHRRVRGDLRSEGRTNAELPANFGRAGAATSTITSPWPP